MTDFPYMPQSRRQLIQRMAGGFGALGLASAFGSASANENSSSAHFRPRAKRVIFLFMNGGPSHVDTFDPKPKLAKFEGQMPGERKRNKKTSGFMPSPFQFKKHGQSGMVMSELFPKLSTLADELCMVRSMHTDVPNHEPALLMMQSGNQQPIRPSLGSWLSYGLGTPNQNLPSYVVLSPGMPVVGPALWSNAFLPGHHQATSIDTNQRKPEELIANLRHPRFSRPQQEQQIDLLHQLNRIHAEQRQQEKALETEIKAMELAYSMQKEATDAFDASKEPAHVRELYGDTPFGRSCLLARRLVERDVRCVEVFYVGAKSKQPWDTHTNNDNGHKKLCADSDQATTALILDLKQRGLLDDTLVIWGGEFGRTPYSQINEKNKKAKPGRDHHHTGFSMFMAGGGTRPGLTHGNTDDFGMHATDGKMHVHDLHATILHLMGLDHEKLTYRYSGRDFRLTDVHGFVFDELFA